MDQTWSTAVKRISWWSSLHSCKRSITQNTQNPLWLKRRLLTPGLLGPPVTKADLIVSDRVSPVLIALLAQDITWAWWLMAIRAVIQRISFSMMMIVIQATVTTIPAIPSDRHTAYILYHDPKMAHTTCPLHRFSRTDAPGWFEFRDCFCPSAMHFGSGMLSCSL